jgi:hypothetical protein
VVVGWIDQARAALTRTADASSGRLDPVLARLPEGTSEWMVQLPWREIALAGLLLGLVLAFYLPRHSRFGHER